MKIVNDIVIYGDPIYEGALEQIKNCQKTAYKVAMMGDHHQGYSMPIGGVCAYKDKISPSGVGYDIACGNKAVLLDIPADELKKNIGKIMDDIFSNISFGVGMKNKDAPDDVLFEDEAWNIPSIKELYDLARSQLGTVGSGNHYVDLFTDEKDRVWCGVHFGSRGLGHKIATHYVKAGGGKDGLFVDPVLLDVNSSLGSEYLAGMELAGKYAYSGRNWVCNRVADILGANILDEVHNHHNFAWLEEHEGEKIWIVRKGATPAFPGQRGFVGGSMGENSVILKGVDSEESKIALYSTVHGAGRVMSRTQAAGKKSWKKMWVCGQRNCEEKLPNSTERNENGSNPKCPKCSSKMHKRKGVRLSKGEISKEMMNEWVNKAGVELRGAGVDESPHCYKRLDEVLNFHKNTIEILHTLKPIGVAMAGDGEFDPYKD